MALLFVNGDHKIYDPAKRFTDESAFEQDIIFICVPTDENIDGSCNTSIVEECIKHCRDTATIVVKSTVPPNVAEELSTRYPHLVFNPEFLTEKNWQQDIRNETRVILGCTDREDFTKVARLYQNVYTQDVSYYECTPSEAMMVKYVSNAYLATKLSFVNEMADICIELGISWDTIRELWVLDKRVGKSHTLITEQRGFGGYCLPKDTAALQYMAKELSAPTQVLDSVIAYNKRVRNGTSSN